MLAHGQKPKESCFLLDEVGFRLQTVKTSLQRDSLRKKGTHEGEVAWCFDTVPFHSRVTFQVGRCSPFLKNAREMHDSPCCCKQPKKLEESGAGQRFLIVLSQLSQWGQW